VKIINKEQVVLDVKMQEFQQLLPMHLAAYTTATILEILMK
jgi:hypothetical protein